MATEKRLVYLDDILTDLHEVVEAAKADPDEIMRMAEACTGTIIKHLEKFPTVDAAPVVHGQWEQVAEADYKCSVCGFRFTTGDPISMFQYCRCGAKMDGG